MAAATFVEAHIGSILFSKICCSLELWICSPEIMILLNHRLSKAERDGLRFQEATQ
jgi:hypothetical protein